MNRPTDVTGLPAGVSRRRVLATSGVLAAAGVSGLVPTLVGAATAQAATASGSAPPGARLVASEFAGLVGHTFSLTSPGEPSVALRLDAVEGAGRAAVSERSFSLRFHGPAARRQGGRVGRLTGPGVPGLRLLVVPSGRAHAKGQDWVVTVIGEVPGE